MLKRWILSSGATFAAFTSLLPETMFLEKIRQVVAKYSWDQTEEPVKEKLQRRFHEVMDDLDLLEKKVPIRLFHVYGYDVYHAGSFFLKSGAVVGIPIHFEYEDVDSINKDDAFIYDRPINWNRQAAKNFLNTLVLSENAQKFAIARELMKIKVNDPVIRMGHVLLHVGLVTMTYKVLEASLKLPTRKKGIQYLVFSAVLAGGIISWIGTAALLNYDSDVTADQRVSNLGPDYIQGGKEFYEKLLKRNIALRTLLGEDGKKLFTTNGNENYVLFQKNAPIFHRKSFFDSKLEDVQQVV